MLGVSGEASEEARVDDVFDPISGTSALFPSYQVK